MNPEFKNFTELNLLININHSRAHFDGAHYSNLHTAELLADHQLRMDFKKDVLYIERQNLLKLTEFAIKETINTSLNEMNLMEIESSQVTQFLAILDSIFKHGIKRSGRQCWKYILEFCKLQPNGLEIVENIMNIPQIKTNQGRVRAWIRLTLMQKTFVDLFTKMTEDKLFLSQYYEPQAFLSNEEAIIVSGLLISLNFTDFNFCLKEENLDLESTTIDVSRYMKLASLETFQLNFAGPTGNGTKDSDQDTISIDSKDMKVIDYHDLYSAISWDGPDKLARWLVGYTFNKLNYLMMKDWIILSLQSVRIYLDQACTIFSRILRSNRFNDLIDQKNYLEEMNRHNTSLITDLREKYKNHTQELQILKSEIGRLTLQNSELETANSLLIANFEKCRCCQNQSHNHSVPAAKIDLQLNNAPPPGPDNETSTQATLSDTLGLIDNLYIPPTTSFLSPCLQQSDANKPDIPSLKNYLILAQNDAQAMSTTVNELKQKLLEEKSSKLKYEYQYSTTLRKNEELEATVKVLEKSERHKQDHMTDLKRQLDDLKAINSEMYTKIENYEASLKHKNELVTRLEQKNKNMGLTINQLEEKYDKLQNYHSSTEDIFGKMERELNKKDQIKLQLENDLKIEREMKISLQHQIQKEKLDFAKRLKEISKAEDILKNNEYLHRKNEELKKKFVDQEQALTELGGQLKESKLQTDDLKDSVLPFVIHSKWQSDKTADDCLACHKPFSTIVRKHHCRNCGGIFCQDCSNYKIPLSFSSKPVRVCSSCHEFLNSKFI